MWLGRIALKTEACDGVRRHSVKPIYAIIGLRAGDRAIDDGGSVRSAQLALHCGERASCIWWRVQSAKPGRTICNIDCRGT